MSSKKVVFQAIKSEFKSKTSAELIQEVRTLIHSMLFHWLRPANDGFKEKLKDPQKAAELLKRFPEMKHWKNPTDAELMEAIYQEKNDINGQGGWEYSVRDETLFVNGILTVYVKEHKASFPMKSWFVSPEVPGLRVYEEVKNED